MVEIEEVLASNRRIAQKLPPHMVAVFAGATSGIGHATMLALARYAHSPRIYVVCRDEEKGEAMVTLLQETNPNGEYIPVIADLSRMKEVDVACNQICNAEKAVHLLVLSQGTLDMSSKTPEGLRTIWALSYYSRMRMIERLLPLLRQAESLRRVVYILAGTKEGPINTADLALTKTSPWKAHGHVSSCITLMLEVYQEQAPEVSFVHSFPGYVPTNLVRTLPKGMGAVSRMFSINGRKVPLEESGERHLFLGTSSRYAPVTLDGVPLGRGVPVSAALRVAISSHGRVGGGVYTVDSFGLVGGSSVQAILAEAREQGLPAMVWEVLREDLERTCKLPDPLPEPPEPVPQPQPEAMPADAQIQVPQLTARGVYPLVAPVQPTYPTIEPVPQPAPEALPADAQLQVPQLTSRGIYPLVAPVQPTFPTRQAVPQPAPEVLPADAQLQVPQLTAQGVYPIVAPVRPTREPIETPAPEPEPEPEENQAVPAPRSSKFFSRIPMPWRHQSTNVADANVDDPATEPGSPLAAGGQPRLSTVPASPAPSLHPTPSRTSMTSTGTERRTSHVPRWGLFRAKKSSNLANETGEPAPAAVPAELAPTSNAQPLQPEDPVARGSASGAQAETQASVQREAQAQAEANARVRAQAQVEAEARARAEAQARAQAAQYEAQARTQAQAEAESRARAQAQAQAQAQAEAEARARAQAQAQAEAEARARAQAQAQAQAEAEARARAQAQMQAQAEAEARARAQAQVQAHTHAEPAQWASADAGRAPMSATSDSAPVLPPKDEGDLDPDVDMIPFYLAPPAQLA